MLFADRLIALRDGRVSFADFWRATRNLWVYMSARLLRVRDPGIGVQLEDVEQEMLLECWRVLPRWDSARGVPIDRYVLFNASARATKWLDAQREACQGARLADNPTRAPRLGRLDTFEREPGSMAVMERPSPGPSPEAVMDAVRFVLPRHATAAERVVVEALVSTRSGLAAALAIYDYYPYRIAFELGSEQAAARLVRRVAERLLNEPALFESLED